MKYLISILEKEFTQDWFNSNPKNYLVKNAKDLEKAKKSKTSFIHYIDNNKNEYPDLKLLIDSIDYKDIELFKEVSFNGKFDRYGCSHSELGNVQFINIEVYTSKDLTNDNSFNRLHTMGIIIKKYLGTGLGYKAYKRVIKEVGYARSSKWRTNLNSRKIWSNLIKDPDFYVMIYLKREDKLPYSKKQEGVMVFHKDMDSNEIKKVIQEFSSDSKWVKVVSYCDPLKRLLNL